MKNLLIALCFVALSIGGWMLARPNPLIGEVAKLERELKTAQNEVVQLKAELAKRSTIPAKPSMATKSAPTASQPAAATANAAKPETSALRQMMEMPGMKEMMKQQNLVQIDMLYGGLFTKFQLSPEEKENLRQLLGSRASAQTEMGLKMMGANLTPEQHKQIAAEYAAAKKLSDENIRTFLGDAEDYKTFQHWEDTQPERMQFEMMGGRSHFSSAGEALAPEQEQQLIDIMASVRKQPSQLPDLSQPENLSPGNLSEEQIARQMQKYDQDAAAVAQQAAAQLSPAQMQALIKFQEQMRSMAELGLKMSNSMLKGQQ
jgi:hypothetical protein